MLPTRNSLPRIRRGILFRRLRRNMVRILPSIMLRNGTQVFGLVIMYVKTVDPWGRLNHYSFHNPFFPGIGIRNFLHLSPPITNVSTFHQLFFYAIKTITDKRFGNWGSVIEWWWITRTRQGSKAMSNDHLTSNSRTFPRWRRTLVLWESVDVPPLTYTSIKIFPVRGSLSSTLSDGP